MTPEQQARLEVIWGEIQRAAPQTGSFGRKFDENNPKKHAFELLWAVKQLEEFLFSEEIRR